MKFFIEKGIHIIVDKPPVAGFDYEFNTIISQRMILEKDNIIAMLNAKTDVKCLVTTQRRSHRGFLYVRKLLGDIVNQYDLPINYMECFHSDGMWNMPDELIYRENHPYRFGYGKIMHSGYHFIDMVFWLQEINKEIEKYSIAFMKFSCQDFVKNIKINNYEQLLKTKDFHRLLANHTLYRGFGEIDSYNIFQFKREDNSVISSCPVNLLQNSFSRRAWRELPEDTYRSNGRLRHEMWNIEIAPVLCVQIHSYQSFENQNQEEEMFFKQGDVGSEDHFDINIFRNTQLIGGRGFEQIKLGVTEKDLMKESRFTIIKQVFDYIKDKKNVKLESEFQDHNNTITAIAEIYNLYKSNQYVAHNIKYFNR